MPKVSAPCRLEWSNFSKQHISNIVFRFTSIKSHWRMLCPNTQAVTNGYSTGCGPRPFSPKRVEIWIWGLEKCI